MPQIESTVRDLIEVRLGELNAEQTRLRKLLAVIDADSEPATKREQIAAINGPGQTKEESVPTNGSRKAQILELLDQGMTPKQVSVQLECAPAYVYSVRRALK
jgi:hypothetical protein